MDPYGSFLTYKYRSSDHVAYVTTEPRRCSALLVHSTSRLDLLTYQATVVVSLQSIMRAIRAGRNMIISGGIFVDGGNVYVNSTGNNHGEQEYVFAILLSVRSHNDGQF